MPHLSRVRFVSVGHPQARMEDLLLDLRRRDGRPTDSTLWLRNGGGKSSLLNLLFAIVRPDRREFLGGKADSRQRRLEDYVLPGDRAVTAAEWLLNPDDGDREAPRRLVTGVFYEHRAGGADAGALRRLFFAARVTEGAPGTTLEGLPIHLDTDQGPARRTLASFRQAWAELGAALPAGVVVATESQREWERLLEVRGLDPGVFSYQIRMNQREGGADELFRFSGPEDFVDFLLQLSVDPELGEQVGRNMGTFRQELVRRKRQLLPEQALVSGLRERLAPLVEAADERAALSAEAAGARGALDALEGWYRHRLRRLSEELERVGDRGQEHRAAADRLGGEAERCRAGVAALGTRAAELSLEEAGAEARRADAALAEARHEARVYEAAVPLRDALTSERRARELRGELDDRLDESAPLRQQLAEAAQAAGAALAHRAQTLEAEAASSRESAAGAEAAAAELGARAGRAREESARAAERARLLSERIAAAGVARGRVEETGALGPGEPTAAAVERLESDLARRGESLRALQPELDDLEEHLERLDRQLHAAAAEAAEAAAEARGARQQLEEVERRRVALETDPELLAALEIESLELDTCEDAALAVVARRARAAQEAILALRLARADDERAAAHLEEGGLMPPSRDVERVLDALRGKVRATSGWAYLAAEVPAERRRQRVTAWPQLACGVAVHDEDLESALALLEEAGVRPEGPVVIAPHAAFSGEAQGEGLTVLGPSDESLYDRAAAGRALAERRARLAASDEAIAAAGARYRTLAALSQRLEDWRTRYPRGWFAARREAVDALDARAVAAGARVDAARGERLGARLEAGQRREKIKALRRDRDAARRTLERVRAYAEDHERQVEGWRRELREARATVEACRSAEGVRAEAEAARVLARECGERARTAAAGARSARQKLAALPYLEGAPAPVPGPIDALLDRLTRLQRQYEQGLGADGLVQAAEENERHARRARAAFSRLLVDGLEEVEVRAALEALDDPSDAERARGEAQARRAAAENRAGTAAQRRRQRADELSRARAAARGAGTWDGELPDLAEVAEARAGELAAEASYLEGEIQRLLDAARAADAARLEAERDRIALEADAAALSALRDANAELLASAAGAPCPAPADAEEARARLASTRDALAALRGRSKALDQRRRAASKAVRAWAGDARFEGLEGPLALRFREVGEADLESCAATFAQQLALRAEHLEGLLADLDRHRGALVTQLLGLAEEGLSLLKAASASSVLPEELGGGHFLRISTRAPADPAERQEIIARLVDDLVEDGRFPDGLGLLQRAVRRLARPIQVQVMHPDPSLSRRMVGIEEMARFSGGEQLTGAILLYCTLARLRARSRGRRRQDTSVLVLDNPIGRASRVRFLELQREVARAMGVQLIYTTGVNDHEALRTLPNIIRLRNERVDRRRGHRLVERAPGGRVESARVARREPARAVEEPLVTPAVAPEVPPLRVA